MKVLYIHHIPQMHGSTLSLFTTITKLKEYGVDPVLVIPEQWKWHPDFERSLKELGVKYYKVYLVQSVIEKDIFDAYSLKQRMGFLFNLFKYKYYSYCGLSSIVKIERPDIIHTNVGVIHEGALVAKRYGIPHVFHLREYQEMDFGWKILPSKFLFRQLLKLSCVFTITDDIRRYFDLLKYSNAYTIYNGIYSRDNTALEYPKQRYFFCASRVSKEKGYDDVIAAFSEFHKVNPEYKLLIAGTANEGYKEFLVSLIKSGKCENNVFFLGQIDNVFDYMKRATALIVGSYSEGFGRMTAEAAFAGCLTIGRYSAGTKEIIDKIGGMGFLDNKELLNQMIGVCQMPGDAYKEKVRQIQDKAVKFFSIEENALQVISYYRRIVKDKQKRCRIS